MAYKTLIVDDEPLARQRIGHLLHHFKNEIEIIGQAADGEEALQFLKSNTVDLVFLDIQMPGMTGLELLQKLPQAPLIIFTTAYDQYALKAFEENAIAYLLKPIEMVRLEKAIRKLQRLTQHQQKDFQEAIQRVLKQTQQSAHETDMQHRPVKIGDRVIFIDYKDIMFFRSEDKIVTINLYEKQYICDDTLNELEIRLEGKQFIRAHRSVLVNMHFVKEAQRWFAGKYRLIMQDKKSSSLPLSRNKKSHFGF